MQCDDEAVLLLTIRSKQRCSREAGEDGGGDHEGGGHDGRVHHHGKLDSRLL